MAGFASMMGLKENLAAQKDRAMNKLEWGRTVDFTADMLRHMPVRELRSHAKSNRLSAVGSPAELRTRLAELLLAERARTNEYRRTIAVAQAQQITDRVDHMLKRKALVEQKWSGLGSVESRNAMLRAGIESSIKTVEKRTATRVEIHQDLAEWHQDFQPIETTEDKGYDRIIGSEIPWAAYSAQKLDVRSAAEQRFLELTTDADGYQRQIIDLKKSIQIAESSARQEEEKVEKLKRALFDQEAVLKDLEQQSKELQSQAMLGANNVALAKKDAEKALAATEEELLELLQQQDDEAARLAQLQVQLEAEREALVKQHDSRLKAESVRLAQENQAIAAKIAAAEQRRVAAHTAAVEEYANMLHKKDREQAESLAKQIAAMERQLAEVIASTEKTDASIMDIDAEAQRERGAKAESEARAAQQRELDEQDPDFMTEKNQFAWWLDHVHRVERVEKAVQVDGTAIFAERFRQRDEE